MNASRRLFLRHAGALSTLVAPGALPLALNLSAAGTAAAQTATDYRALVCLFFYGGNDGLNMVVPRDATGIAGDAGWLALEGAIMKVVDEQLGAVARPARVRFVTALPKTRSGKLLRRAIQAVCEGRDAGDLTTIEDPAALQQIRDQMAR